MTGDGLEDRKLCAETCTGMRKAMHTATSSDILVTCRSLIEGWSHLPRSDTTVTRIYRVCVRREELHDQEEFADPECGVFATLVCAKWWFKSAWDASDTKLTCAESECAKILYVLQGQHCCSTRLFYLIKMMEVGVIKSGEREREKSIRMPGYFTCQVPK